MESTKLPIAIVAAMVIQISGGVWWVSQQAAKIEFLDNRISEMEKAHEKMAEDHDAIGNRVVILENELKHVDRDHMKMMDSR